MMIARVPRTDSTRWKLIQKVCIQAQSMSQSIIKFLFIEGKKTAVHNAYCYQHSMVDVSL